MPLINFRPAPGINKEVTDYTGQGKWTDGDMVRFFQGSAQKIKGWEKFISTTLVGAARDMHNYVALDGTRYNVIGTDRKLYIYSEGKVYDITPIRATDSLTNPFATSSGSATVTVTDAGHQAEVGAFVTFDNGSTTNVVDGIDFNNEFEIITVPSSNTYTINAGTNASGTTAAGGGSTDASYQINPGPTSSTYGYGWG